MASGDTRAAAARLDALRATRGGFSPDRAVRRPIANLLGPLRRGAKARFKLVDTWQEIAPADIVDAVSIEGPARGTLTLVVESSAASHRVNEHLRSGLDRKIVAATPATVRKVKVVVRPGVSDEGVR